MAKVRKSISVNAIPVQQGDFKFYLFSMSASQLYHITEINRRSERQTRRLSESAVERPCSYHRQVHSSRVVCWLGVSLFHLMKDVSIDPAANYVSHTKKVSGG